MFRASRKAGNITRETILSCRPSGCLRDLTPENIAALYLDGTRRIGCADVSCPACAGAGRAHLEDLCEGFDALLAARGLPGLEFVGLDPAALGAWRRRRREAPADMGRRRLFVPPEDTPTALRRLQAKGAQRPGVPFAHVPVIDAERCSGCSACVRVCPEGVISLADSLEGGGAAYRVRPTRCCGCALCVDVCPESALRLDRFAPAPVDLQLAHSICPSCGADKLDPVAKATDGVGPCRVCRAVRSRPPVLVMR